MNLTNKPAKVSFKTKSSFTPRNPPIRTKIPVKKIKPLTMSSITNIEIIGKGVVYFTMFYCTLNWVHYRGIRKRVEHIQEKRDTHNKKDDSENDDER